MIKEEVTKWQQEGAHILYRHRVIRDGYKAGNLKSAMNCSYVKDYEFVAIFDADFQPTPDFLKRTVPHFKVSNPSCIQCVMISEYNVAVSSSVSLINFLGLYFTTAT